MIQPPLLHTLYIVRNFLYIFLKKNGGTIYEGYEKRG
ncbi:hypothetical protein BASH2_00947 [Bacillus anthracis]|nr:hypothetical protein BASH2_00947 [Bacillus anthracis]